MKISYISINNKASLIYFDTDEAKIEAVIAELRRNEHLQTTHISRNSFNTEHDTLEDVIDTLRTKETKEW